MPAIPRGVLKRAKARFPNLANAHFRSARESKIVTLAAFLRKCGVPWRENRRYKKGI